MVTKKPQRCKVEGCNRIINTKRKNKSGFCSYHYIKNKRKENGWYKRRMVEDDTLLNYKKLPTEIQLNYDRIKGENESHNKLLKKIIKHFSSETLIQELKRRKLIKFNWENDKWEKKN